MKTILRYSLLAALISGAGGCAFRHEAMIDPTMRQASSLGAYLDSAKVNSPTKLQADTTLNNAKGLLAKKEKEEAYFHADLALARYRLALAQEDLRLTQQRDSLYRSALMQDLQELSAYEKLLTEVKAKRGAQ